MIPDYVENKPKALREEWKSIKESYGGAIGLAVANKWLINQPTCCVESLTFVTEKEQVVMRSIGGVEYVDFMLADNEYDSYGTKYSDSFLKELAKMINDGDLEDGDFNHDTLNKLTVDGAGKEFIKSNLSNLKKGVAKVVKAIYEKGKLFLRTIINPNYKDRVLNSKGVSIEGSFVREGDTFVSGKLLGFSFIDKDTKDLGNPRAKILK